MNCAAPFVYFNLIELINNQLFIDSQFPHEPPFEKPCPRATRCWVPCSFGNLLVEYFWCMWVLSLHSHLTHTRHPCHGQITVAVQLQRSLAEEEVDLIVVSIFTVAALPDQRRTHKVWLCTRQKGKIWKNVLETQHLIDKGLAVTWWNR